MNPDEGLPLCGWHPHCDQIVLDAIERFVGNKEVVRHLQGKKAVAEMVLNLCAMMRDRESILRLACEGCDFGVGKDGSVTEVGR